jgi:hypothetical protein
LNDSCSHEHDYVDPHKNCSTEDDPPLILGEDFRLCELEKRAKSLGLETTID